MREPAFHMTRRAFLPSILREGLRPRGDRPANYHGEGLDSNPAYVYFSTSLRKPWHGVHYEDECILQINPDGFDDDLIREDEDHFGKVTFAYEGMVDPSAIESVWYYHRREDERGLIDFFLKQEEIK